MRSIILLLLLSTAACSTLMTAGAAAGGAALGSLAGPGGAAIGGAAGVVAIDLIEEGEAPVDVVGTGPAATIHETVSLVETIGLWYLALFVLVPFLTKRGRGWFRNLTALHNNVSREELEKTIEELKNK